MGNKSSLLYERQAGLSGERRDRSWSFTGNMGSPTLSGLKASRSRAMSLSQNPRQSGNSQKHLRLPSHLHISSPLEIQSKINSMDSMRLVSSSSLTNVNQPHSWTLGKSDAWDSPCIKNHHARNANAQQQQFQNWSSKYATNKKLDLQNEKKVSIKKRSAHASDSNKQPVCSSHQNSVQMQCCSDDVLDLKEDILYEGFRPRTNSTSIIEMGRKHRSRVVMGAASANLRRQLHTSQIAIDKCSQDSAKNMNHCAGDYVELDPRQTMFHEQQNFTNEQVYLRKESRFRAMNENKMIDDICFQLPPTNTSRTNLTPKLWAGKTLLPDIHEEKILSSSVPNCNYDSLLKNIPQQNNSGISPRTHGISSGKNTDFMRKRSCSISHTPEFSAHQQMHWNLPPNAFGEVNNREILIHYSPSSVRKFPRKLSVPILMTPKTRIVPEKERLWNYNVTLGDSCPNLTISSNNSTGHGLYLSQNNKDPDAIRNLKSMEGFMDNCPSCHLPFDKGKKRRLIDSCGHERCYSCMFNVEQCPLCENTANPAKTNGHFSRQSSVESAVFTHHRPKLKTNGHFTTYMQTRMDISPSPATETNPFLSQPSPKLASRNAGQSAATPRLGVVQSSKTKITKAPLLTSPPVSSPTPPPLPPKNYLYNELGIPKHYSSDSALGSPDVSSVSVSVTTDDIDELPELDREGPMSEITEEAGNGMPAVCKGNSPPPPPPDVAQNDLMARLGLLLEELSSSEQMSTGSKEGNCKEEAFTSISSLTSSETTPDKGISDTSPISTLTVSSGSEHGLHGPPRNISHHHHNHHHHLHSLYTNCTQACTASDSMTSLRSFSIGNGASPLHTMQRPHSINIRFAPIRPPQLKMFPIKFEIPHSEGKSVFIGREWLFKEIEMALNSEWSSQTQGVVLQGDVGSGKTAVIEQLLEYSCFGNKTQGPTLINGDAYPETNGKDRPRQNGYQSSPCGTLSSLSSSSVASHNSYLSASSTSLNYDSLKSLGCQVVAYHICQADNNTTCMLPDFVHSIAATLARAPQLEAYREMLLVDPNLFNILTMKECIQNPYQSFVKGVLEPLKMLKSSGKITSDSCIILVDSLNEAEFHRPDYGDTIGSFLLHYLHKFPMWLKVIVTVRTSYIEITRQLPFFHISIDTCDATVKDLHDYISYRINVSTDLQNNIAVDETGTQNKFCNYLQTLSNGSFLYCKLVLDLIERGNLVLKSSNYKIIPINISEVFLLHFNLKFPSVRSYERIYPILGVCLASLYPLNQEEIYEAINSGSTKKYISRDEFLHRLEILSGFLYHRETDNTYMFFHPAFRDWLIKRDENEHRKFLCELRYGHSLMAFRLSRICSNQDPEKSLELGHHILKANIYKNLCRQSQFSSRVFLAYWMCLCSDNLNAALVTQRNLFSPNVKVSRLLILAGANPNAKSNFLNQAPILCVSAREGFLEMVSSLLEFSAYVDAVCEDGMTALCHAAANGHLDVIKLLCSKKANLSHTDKCGQCPAVHAAMHGHLESLAFLLQCDWSSASSQQQKIEAMQQAFVAAAAMGHKHICDYLVVHAVGRSNEAFSIDAVDTLIGETALTAACLHGREEVVRYLIKQEANVHLANTKSYSPLLCAVKANKCEVAEILFQAGASIEQPDKNGHTPLMLAAAEGHINILEMLLSAEASQTEVDKDEMTALSLACLHGHLQIVQILLSRGSDLHHVDKNGQIPLHLASFYGEPQIVQYLIDQGANIEHVDSNNMRPLDRAIACKNIDVIMCFLKKGAKLSPATWTMAVGKPSVMLVLLKKLMDDGNILYKKNRVKEAAQRFQYALRKFPKDGFGDDARTFYDLRISLLLNLSKCKRKLQDYIAAIELATKVLEIRPKSFEGYYARARARRDNKQYDSALEDLKQAVFLVPNNAELQRLLLRLRSECLEQANILKETPSESTDVQSITVLPVETNNTSAAAITEPAPAVTIIHPETEDGEVCSSSSVVTYREETAL
ncbi:protein TANC1 isoform X2 [Octopus bimaculoides]|uniref:protein TANC1 isoform X2 n=1 Tax=Octopus bimaculoides TaxID=37653 RepID=UPI00071CD184|nr:protein TANC1 isoform X2 [Octopus bimaculoides]|eukprot:XP_014779861.1 PREDICTED: protein TANC1-like isoform X2 [Octopus bimaculoides]